MFVTYYSFGDRGRKPRTETDNNINIEKKNKINIVKKYKR